MHIVGVSCSTCSFEAPLKETPKAEPVFRCVFVYWKLTVKILLYLKSSSFLKSSLNEEGQGIFFNFKATVQVHSICAKHINFICRILIATYSTAQRYWWSLASRVTTLKTSLETLESDKLKSCQKTCTLQIFSPIYIQWLLLCRNIKVVWDVKVVSRRFWRLV